MICRHCSHFTQSPSVLTFFSPEVSSSCGCRLNHVIAVPIFWPWIDDASASLVLDAPLRHDALLIGMFYFAHLGHRVGQISNCGVCIPPRQDYVHHRWLLA